MFQETLGSSRGPQALDESATDGLISTDAEGRISYANRVAERVIGQPRRFLLDRPLAEILASLYELAPEDAVKLVTRMLGGDGEERLFRPVAGGKPGWATLARAPG